MVRRKYFLFLEALLVAAFVFSFGILAGVFIENARVARVESNFAQIESDLLDARLLSDLIQSSVCELAVKENMDFADRVFFEAKLLEKYESSSEITDTLKIQHKKYDLLRAMVWMNSITIKKNCNSTYHNVVYVYQYNNLDIAKRAKQAVISNSLSDLKNEMGDRMLLISIAGDIGSPSIDLLISRYNITELPVVVIDEKTILTDISSIDSVKSYLN